MSQNLPVNNFGWIKETFQFNEDFIKNYNKESDKRYFLKLMFNIRRNYLNFIMIYHFYHKELNLESRKAYNQFTLQK